MDDLTLELDPERAWTKARALDLMDELGILSGRIRDAMLEDVERAVAVLQHAKSAPHVRNPASLAIANWRRGADPRPRARSRTFELEREVTEQPPTLSALEFAWSRDRSPIGGALIAMMGYAIARSGGASAMLAAGWWTRERYDVDGELVERALGPNP